MSEELHLIVLWQNARYKQKEILDDIKSQVKILEVIEIEWSPENVASNFTRFYGVKLPNRSFKEKECGRGKFLTVVVKDQNPVYDYVETSRGFEYINKHLFELKEKYRSWTRGGHKIHTTNTPAETNHDITLLLGVNYNDYLKTAPVSWDGSFKQIKRDITGCNGWKDIKEFFYVLNATSNYCVLRNYEILPEKFRSDLHGDIDILTDNYDDMVFLTGAKPVFKKKYRVHNKVKIAGQDVFFDFRSLGDNYYCYDFEYNILKTRLLNENNIYVPNPENAFYSLVYHCVIQKKEIAVDYYDKVKSLFLKLNYNKSFNPQDYRYPFDFYYELLDDFMFENHYNYVKPNDLSVHFNKKYVNYKNNTKRLSEEYNITDIRPYVVGQIYSLFDFRYFTGKINNEKVFIKYGGYDQAVQNEYRMLKKLYDVNNINFLKPYLYKCNKDNSFVVTEYMQGKMLDNLMKENNLSQEQKNSFIKQLENIADNLATTKIAHRDIHPKNIMVTQEGILKLIDMQFAVNTKKYRETSYLRKHIQILANLGYHYNPALYCWDDMFSINKIINELGGKSESVKKIIGKYRIHNILYKIVFYIIKIPSFLYKKTKLLIKKII